MKRILSMTFLLLSMLLVIGCYGQPTILEVEQAPYERYSDFIITDSIELYEYTEQVGAIVEYYETITCDDESLIAIDDGFLQDSAPNSVLDFEQLDPTLKDLDFLTSCEMTLLPCAPVGTQRTAIVVRPENEKRDIPAPQGTFGEPPKITIGIEDQSFSAKASAVVSNLFREPDVQAPSECLLSGMDTAILSQNIIQNYYGDDLQKAFGVIKPLHTKFQDIFPKIEDNRFECQVVHDKLSRAVSEIDLFAKLYLHYLQQNEINGINLTEIARKAIPYIYPANNESLENNSSDHEDPYLVAPSSISLANKPIMTREDEYHWLISHPQVKLDPDQQQSLYQAMVCGEKSEEEVELISTELLRLEFADQDEEQKFLSAGMDTSEARGILRNALNNGPGSGGGAGEQSPESASTADANAEFIERTLAAHAACKARGPMSTFNCDAIIMDTARALRKMPISNANSTEDSSSPEEVEEESFLTEVYYEVLQFFGLGETEESSAITEESSAISNPLTDGFSEEGKKLLEQLHENDENAEIVVESLTIAEIYLEGFGTGPDDAFSTIYQEVLTNSPTPHVYFLEGHGARQADLISGHLIVNNPKGDERRFYEGLERAYLSIGK